MTDVTGHTISTCTCGMGDSAADWHNEHCPRYANQCGRCDGGGVRYIPLSCGCCTDIDTCDRCDGTGNEPASKSDDLVPQEKAGG